jgi:hypothetical protein
MGVKRTRRVIVYKISPGGVIKQTVHQTKVDPQGTEETEIEFVGIGEDGRTITDPSDLFTDPYGAAIHRGSVRQCAFCSRMVSPTNFFALTRTCLRPSCILGRVILVVLMTFFKILWKVTKKVIKTILTP